MLDKEYPPYTQHTEKRLKLRKLLLIIQVAFDLRINAAMHLCTLVFQKPNWKLTRHPGFYSNVKYSWKSVTGIANKYFQEIILSIYQSSVKPICKNFKTATQQKGLSFFLFLNERIHNDQEKCWEVYWFRKLCQWIRHQLIAKIQNPRMLCVQWGVSLIWSFVNWMYNLNKFKKSVLHLNRLRKNTDQTIETVKQSKRFFKRNL